MGGQKSVVPLFFSTRLRLAFPGLDVSLVEGLSICFFWVDVFRVVLIPKEIPPYDFLVTSLRDSIFDRRAAHPLPLDQIFFASYHPLLYCESFF